MSTNIFSKFKDSMLDFMEHENHYRLRFPMPKTGQVISNYTRGDFIVVGGRKTSGKSSFMLSNYVMSPMLQRISKAKTEDAFKTHIIYINSRKNPKTTIERMVVNYVSSKNKGNKVSVPSMYGYEGKYAKLSRPMAKKAMVGAMGVFDTLARKNILSVVSSKQTVYEIEALVQEVMSNYGTFHNHDELDFEYNEGSKDVIPILVIDDITAIIGDGGGSVLKFDAAHKVGIRLKNIAKMLNMVVVLGVPSSNMYSKGAFHKSSVDEVAPYNLYADRVLIMHNPLETDDKKFLGYETKDFINKVTGICYLRMLFIASNYMGPSGIYIPYFMYPENGFLRELPRYDDEESLDEFFDIVNQ